LAHQLVDQLLKKMAEYHAEEFIRLAFPDADFEVIATKLEKELIIKTKIVDSVIKIAVGDEQYLVHFEFQTEYKSDIPRRMFIYAGALTAKYDLKVASILFQIKPPPKNLPVIIRYDVRLFGNVVNSFSFHCVKLWEYQAEILTGKQEYLGFVPLLLELSSQPDKALLVRQRDLIQQEKDIIRRTELTGLCLVFASKYFDFNFLKEFFKEDIDMLEGLEQVPYIGEKIKTARSEGLQKGIQSDIIETVNIRFHSTNGTENLINNIHDIALLRKVFHLALTTNSLEAFKKSVVNLLNNGQD